MSSWQNQAIPPHRKKQIVLTETAAGNTSSKREAVFLTDSGNTSAQREASFPDMQARLSHREKQIFQTDSSNTSSRREARFPDRHRHYLFTERSKYSWQIQQQAILPHREKQSSWQTQAILPHREKQVFLTCRQDFLTERSKFSRQTLDSSNTSSQGEAVFLTDSGNTSAQREASFPDIHRQDFLTERSKFSRQAVAILPHR